MKRTIVYIDGYNLYYRLLRGTGDKWLDLYSFSKGLLNSDHDIIEVKYFTSMVVPYPYDAAAIERQNVYIQAVAANPKVRVILGYYSKKPAVLPARSANCRECAESKNGFVRVFKFEEKRTDVNMAVSIVRDAAQNAADSYVLVTGDSDQVATVHAVRKDFKKPVLVFDPHDKVCDDLKRAATFYRPVPRNLASTCHLPSSVIDANGQTLVCPAAWQ